MIPTRPQATNRTTPDANINILKINPLMNSVSIISSLVTAIGSDFEGQMIWSVDTKDEKSSDHFSYKKRPSVVQ